MLQSVMILERPGPLSMKGNMGVSCVIGDTIDLSLKSGRCDHDYELTKFYHTRI